MSDHEFEQQVRQKLDNLKLTPSAEAWENIEEKLQERRRRVPLFWLPFLVAGLVAGGYFIVHPGKEKSQGNPVAAHQINKDLKDLAVTKGSVIPEKKATPQISNIFNSPVTTIQHAPTLLSLNDRPKQELHSNIANKRTHNKRAQYSAIEKEQQVPKEQQSDVSEKQIIAAPQDQQASEAAGQEKEKKVTKKIVPVATPDEPKSAVASVPKPAIKKSTGSKWTYAINGFSGVSAVNAGGLLGSGKPNIEDVAYTPGFATISASYAPVYKPSTISPGFTFSVGAEIKRELSKRFSVSAGLNYTQLNTRSKVGDRINSSNIVNNGVRGYLFVQSYYLLDQNENKEYKNKYHFIELPITLHTRLNNSEKLPIYWDAGIVVSRLLSSTSLHFDGTTGVYYKNDKLLNQTQMGLATGVSFALFNKTAHPLWIGPSVRSNISSILKKDISASQHFVTLGLDVKFFLKK
jgi:hypothetical protein